MTILALDGGGDVLDSVLAARHWKALEQARLRLNTKFFHPVIR